MHYELTIYLTSKNSHTIRR